MTLPGMPGGQYTADGLEHNPLGNPSSRAEDHSAQLEKRKRKLEQFEYGDHWASIEGSGETAVITWGSSCGPVREALALMAAEGIPTRLVAIRLLLPIQPERLASALKGVKRVLVVEQSHGAQFHLYLRAHYDLPGEVKSLAIPGPLMIRPDAVYHRLTHWEES